VSLTETQECPSANRRRSEAKPLTDEEYNGPISILQAMGTYQQLERAIPRSQEWMMKNLKPHQNQMLQEVQSGQRQVGWKSEDTQGDYFTNFQRPFHRIRETEGVAAKLLGPESP
jgi:hypothetical protein